MDYENAFIKVKNDEIRLIHPIDKKIGTFSNGSKVIFRGHSHVSGVKSNENPGGFSAYVPTCSNMFYNKEYEYPGIYDVNFNFNNNGLISDVHINSYIYVDKFVKVGVISHTFDDAKKFNSIKYEETPKKLILTK